MLVERTITGVLKDADGNLLTSKVITFTPAGVFGGGGVSVPPVKVTVTTNASTAAFSITLLTSDVADSFVRYFVKFSDGSIKKFDLIDGAPTTLDELINLFDGTAGASNTQLLTDLDSRVDALEAAPAGIWGGITGTLTSQTDLVAYVAAQIAAIPAPQAAGEAGGLNFAGQPANVNAGKFWTLGTTYGDAYWSAWVKATIPNATGYYISDGSGGAHNVLNGVATDTTGYGPTGNIWNGTTTLTYSGVDHIPLGDWAHIEWINYGKTMYCLIDGVPTFYGALTDSGTWSATYTGDRSYPTGGSDGNLYIGGSYHNNFPGIVKNIRGVEGSSAGFTSLNLFNQNIPVNYDGYINGTVRASFSMGFEAGGTRSFTDHGEGFESRVHHGAFSRYNNEIPWPAWVAGEPAPSTYVPTAPTPPSGALVYDSFSRVNSLPIFDEVYKLGSTEGGSLGVKTWVTDAPTADNTGAGIIYGQAYVNPSSYLPYVVTDRSDVDVYVTRPNKPWASTGLRLRWDGVNYFKITAGDDHVEMDFTQGGVQAFQTPFTVPTGWTVLRVKLAGTSMKIYTDGVLRDSRTVTHTTGVKHGLAMGPTVVARYDDFAILPIIPDTTPPTVPGSLVATPEEGGEDMTLTYTASTDSEGVSGYEYRINGGSAVDVGVDLSPTITALTPSTSYTFEVRAYDAAGNRSAWSSVVTQSTSVAGPPLIWANYTAPGWILHNGDKSLEATSSSFGAYSADVTKVFSSVGHQMVFDTIIDTNTVVRWVFTDSLGKQINTAPNGVVSMTDYAQQYLDAYGSGTTLTAVKTGATEFTFTVAGHAPVVINQPMTGTVTVKMTALTFQPCRVKQPVTNIP